jgi:adenylate kinase
MGKRLLLFGPPGVGKGTHSRRLAVDFGIPHIATGDIFRNAIQNQTPLGREAAEYMNRGALVPDATAVSMLKERLAQTDTADGYLLDGFPRTLPQAEVLEERLRDERTPIDGVLSLEAPEELLIQRVAGRMTCSACGASFNRFFRPTAVAGRCDSCQSPLSQRGDDYEATVRRRLSDYLTTTAPVLDFFRAKNWPVKAVWSVGGVDEVYDRIHAAAGSA